MTSMCGVVVTTLVFQAGRLGFKPTEGLKISDEKGLPLD